MAAPRDAELACFRLHRPAPPLDRHVAGIWRVRGDVPVTAETVLPNGVVELIFNLGRPHRVVAPGPERWFREAWLAGLQQAPLTIASLGTSDLVGVRFRPGGARAFFGMPLALVTDGVVELADLDRPDAVMGRLRDELGAVHPDDAVQRLEAALRRRLRTVPYRPGDPRVAAALRMLPTAPSLRAVAGRVGVSHKHLISRFHDEVGVSPSRLRRILRFDAVVRSIAGDPAPRWATVAAAHGFSDQSHLVREFHTFAGVTPSDFLRARLPDQAHLDASHVTGGSRSVATPG